MVKSIFILWNLNVILESLPISSSGHLKLLTHFLFRTTKHAIDSSTEHLMHIPNGILILIFLMYQNTGHLSTLTMVLSFGLAIAITNALTGCAYLIIKNTLEKVPLSLGFLCSGLALLSLSYAPVGTLTTISLYHAFLIGIAQTVALIPGVSRMALTTATGIWLGIDPHLSFFYSLACELILILIAVGTALQKKGSALVSALSRVELAILAGSSIVSYAALSLSCAAFVTTFVVFIGWYLLAVSFIIGFSSLQKSA